MALFKYKKEGGRDINRRATAKRRKLGHNKSSTNRLYASFFTQIWHREKFPVLLGNVQRGLY